MFKTKQNHSDIPSCSSSAEYAVHLGKQGYTCSESVVMAFADRIGLAPETAARIACGFAGGMAQGKTCGAVTGAIMVIGMKYGAGPGRAAYARDLCFQHFFPGGYLKYDPSLFDLLDIDLQYDEMPTKKAGPRLALPSSKSHPCALSDAFPNQTRDAVK